MDCLTIQNKKVLEILNSDGIYKANIDYAKEPLKEAYKNMMIHYGYESCPIFLAPIGYPGQMYGAKTESVVLLKINVPNNMLKIQKYYTWSDYIYFLELKNAGLMDEFQNTFAKGYTFEQFEKDVFSFSGPLDIHEIYQITIPILKKEWLVDSYPLSKEFEGQYIGQGGVNILKI